MPKITLAAARKNAGMSQREAAKKLGIAFQTLSRWENNPGEVKVKNLESLAKLYKIPISYIFLQK